MSERDVEIVRRAFAEFSEGVAEGNSAASFDSGLVSPEFVWTLPPDAPGLQQAYVGRNGWLTFMQTWTEDFEWAIDLEEAVDVGDGRVVVVTTQHATGKASGVPVELRMGAVWTVRDDQVVRAENYLEPAEAFAAAGISEA